MYRQITGLGAMIFDLCLPRSCPLCRTVTRSAGLCVACWQKLSAITTPLCTDCGRPLPYALPGDLCGPCHIRPFCASPIRAGFCYDEGSRALILPFKHADRIDLAPVMALMLAPLFCQLAAAADFVLPVPLHPRRYFSRRYNQSAELARHLCQRTGCAEKFMPALLQRQRNTPTMGGLSADARQRNVSRAFSVGPQGHYAEARHILLIDDVMTTGATINACAASLKTEAGARAVSALVFARVV